MTNLIVAIPTLNEEKNIENCLLPLKGFANKVYILDSGSTDNTIIIAKKYNVEILKFDWDGKFPKKRNWFLLNHAPKTGWVLFLDADEIINEKFKSEVIEAIQQNEYNGFWIRYSRFFMGSKLKGGYPLDKLALFKIGGQT
jgi:glycosyltransferase involved in cell wall biosynthesis